MVRKRASSPFEPIAKRTRRALRYRPSDDDVPQFVPPFLRLPVELRLQIYENVLGGRTIHIFYEDPDALFPDETTASGRPNSDASSAMDLRQPGRGLLSFPCNARITEQEAYTEFLRENDEMEDHPPSAMRHRKCISPFHHASKSRTPGLSLLRVSKQIHREARLIVYKKNLFSFLDAASFNHFLESLPALSIGAINAIHITMCVGEPSRFLGVAGVNDLWSFSEHAAALRSLKTLRLCVEMHHWEADEYAHFRDIKTVVERDIFSGLFALARIGKAAEGVGEGLRYVTVVASDAHWLHFIPRLEEWWREFRWSIEVRREWAEEIRQGLLGKHDYGIGKATLSSGLSEKMDISRAASDAPMDSLSPHPEIT